MAIKSLCFQQARRKVSEEEWTWHMVQHMRGDRHKSLCHPTPDPMTPLVDPVGNSIRKLALEPGYQVLNEDEAKIYQKLILDALQGNLDAVKADFGAVKDMRPQLNPLQPVTVSGAWRGHVPVLQFGLDNGAVMDRDVALAIKKRGHEATPSMAEYYQANKETVDDVAEPKPGPVDPVGEKIIWDAIKKTAYMW